MAKIADLYVEYRSRGLTALSAKMKVLGSRLKVSNAGLVRLGQTSKRVFLIAGAATAAAVWAAVKFEKQLAMVNTMLDKSTAHFMGDYERGLKSLAIEFGQSTATLSKGLYDILSASIEASKALGVLKVSVLSAGAGFTDTAISADAITTIMNSYGMKAEDAMQISDKLFATVKRGKLTYEQLASSIGKVAATAATSGLSLDQLLSSISTITRAGINADQAMTAVVGTIRSFLKPTSEGRKLARELGFELSVSTLKAIGFTGVMKKINGLSMDQASILFPNIRGLKGVAAAMQDATGLAKDLVHVTNSAGMTMEAETKAAGTLSRRLGKLKESYKLLFAEMGGAMDPIITKLTKFLMLVNLLPTAVKKVTGVAVLAAAGLGALGMGIGLVAKAWDGLIKVFALSKVAFAGVAGGLIKIKALFGGLSVAVGGWAAAIVAAGASLSVLFVGLTKGAGLREMWQTLTFQWIGVRKRVEKESAEMEKAANKRYDALMKKRAGRTKAETEADELLEAQDRIKALQAKLSKAPRHRSNVLRIATLRAQGRPEAADEAQRQLDRQKWEEDFNRRKSEALSNLAAKDMASVASVYDAERKAWERLQVWKESQRKREKQKKLEDDRKTEADKLKREVALEKRKRKRLLAEFEREGKQDDRKELAGIRTRLGGLRGIQEKIVGAMPESQRRKEEAKMWGEETSEALGPALSKTFAGTISSIQKMMSATPASSGRWMGMKDVWKGMQSAALSPEMRLSQKQLDELKLIRKAIEEQGKKAKEIVGV